MLIVFVCPTSPTDQPWIRILYDVAGAGNGITVGRRARQGPGAPRTDRAAWGELGAALKRTALEQGLILRADGAGWFAMAPAFCAGEAELEELASLIRESLKAALDQMSKRT